MLLSVDLDDSESIKNFSIRKAITIAKMIDPKNPRIQFLLNSQSLTFTIKDKLPGNPSMGTYYSPAGRADIYVDDSMSHGKMMATVLHEFAHHLQYKSRFKSEGWTTDHDHPGQQALYKKYKALCEPYYAAHSPKEMAAEAFRLLMGWKKFYLDWELDQSFKNDWFDFFYSEEMFSNCLGASIDESVTARYYDKMVEEMIKEDMEG